MLRHFPFTEKFDLRMGTSPLPDDAPLIESDEHYETEVALKRKLLTDDPAYYFRASDDVLQAQWEALDFVLTNCARWYPQWFALEKNGAAWCWANKRLNERHEFRFGDNTTLPFPPLDWTGRQVQEDLIILDSSLVVKAGQLCFPSGWDLDEKFGKQFMAVHEPLPALTQNMISTANKFLDRLPVGKTFQRNNWGFRVCDQLDLSSRHSSAYARLLTEVSERMTPATAGDSVFVRIEHQTLSRLPVSGCVLFTIHTYHSLLHDEASDQVRRKTLLSFLKGVPLELQKYKLIDRYHQNVITYLEAGFNE